MNNILDILRKSKCVGVAEISKHTGVPMTKVSDALKNIKEASGEDIKKILIFLSK